jgi:cytochrome P450
MRPQVDFDHNDRTLGSRQGEYLAELRQQCPVGFSARHGGFWYVSAYDDVVAVARDSEDFSSADGLLIPASGASVRVVPPEIDPPEHTAYRKMLLSFFSARAVDDYEPMVREIINSTLDEFSHQGEADLARDFAVPVPAMVIAGVLDLHRADWREMRELGDAFMAASVSQDAEAKVKANRALEGWLQEQIDARAGKPGQDRLSRMINAEIEGGPIPPERILGMVQVLFLAGHETTVHGIASMLYRVADTPGVRQRVLTDRSLIPAVCRESLRLDSPVPYLGRTATRDLEFRGCEMASGERVVVLYAAANRDADKFADPHTFDIDRQAAGHVAFGSGRHRCLGENLAMLEMSLALEAVLDRIPDYQIAPGAEVGWMSGGASAGVTSLPVVFTPTLRS